MLNVKKTCIEKGHFLRDLELGPILGYVHNGPFDQPAPHADNAGYPTLPFPPFFPPRLLLLTYLIFVVRPFVKTRHPFAFPLIRPNLSYPPQGSRTT